MNKEMKEKLKSISITDDMKEQNMTDKIVDTLKEMGYEFYGPAYKQCAVDIAMTKKIRKWTYRQKPKLIKISNKEFHAFPAEEKEEEKEIIVYLFEVKRKGTSRHVISTLIMQGIGQLLKYHSEISNKIIGIEIRAFLIYCGFVSKEDKDIVERSIKKFNLPVELIVIPVVLSS